MNSQANYLPTLPTGEDLSGLKPQKAISDAIARHILDYDKEHADGEIMPKVVGLEGKWGSGKSNVVKQLGRQDPLKKDYFVIEFDTWAYQEDDYRISLMEHITSALSQMCPQKSNVFKDLLRKTLSKEEFENVKFEPHVSGLLLFLLGTIAFTSLFGLILSWFPDNDHYRWCRLLFVVFPWIILSIYAWFKKKDIDDLLVVFEKAIRNGATTRSVYTREPSVSDLRRWLVKASELCGKKLVVVIDNMDRLPYEKLKKLWSMIHVFANNEEMNEAWIVIPYDEQKLKNALNGECKDYKQYIRKTIPITFNVGEPIVSDLRDVFDGLYEKAFGKNEPNLTYIRALFGITNDRYSIRDIIYFINNMVSVRRQFEGFSQVSIALYVVMEDDIKEHPYKVLLADWFASDYATVMPVTEDNRNEVAAMVYHVEKDDAMQVVYENMIDHAVMGDDYLSTEGILDRDDFYKVLTNYCSNVEEHTYEGYIDVLAEVEDGNPKEKYRPELNICWQHVIQYYLGHDPFKLPWVSSERMQKMLAHCDESQKHDMFGRYAYDLFSNRDTKGGDVYNYAVELERLIEQFNEDREKIFATIQLTPVKFKEYLDTAKEYYARYPIVCDSDVWMDFCCQKIEKTAGDLMNVCYMGHDERFDFTKLKKKIEEIISGNDDDDRNALNAYIIYRSLSERPVNVKPARRIAVSDVINTFDHRDDDPVFIALRMYHNNRSELDDSLVPKVAEEMLYLMYPLEIFQRCYQGNIMSFVKVTKCIIKNKMMCDCRLQSNALEISKPLLDKGIVTKVELEAYLEACNSDADERNLATRIYLYNDTK